MNDTKTRLVQLMLYRQAGGFGYNPAIEKLGKENPDFYAKLKQELTGIDEDWDLYHRSLTPSLTYKKDRL